MNPLLLSGIFEIGKGLIDRFFPDPEKKAAAQLELLKMQQSGELAAMASMTDVAKAQLAVNQAEAASGDKYAARWRPTFGYVGAASLAFVYLLNPLFLWIAAIVGSDIKPPQIYVDEHLWELMTGMLGLAGWRTLDKIKGK